MDISHLGFVTGLLEDAGLPSSVERDVLAAIHARSIHDLSSILDTAGVANGRRDRILALAAINGPFSTQLPRAKALIRGERMETACRELEALCKTLKPAAGQTINLDFSVVGDLDYYNGLVLRGYIKGIPGVVLGGGRYDNLMAKLGKKSTAVGFAVYLHRLEGYYADYRRQTDILLLYPPDCNWAALLAEAERLSGEGFTVRCEREDSDCDALSYARVIRFEGGNGHA